MAEEKRPIAAVIVGYRDGEISHLTQHLQACDVPYDGYTFATAIVITEEGLAAARLEKGADWPEADTTLSVFHDATIFAKPGSVSLAESLVMNLGALLDCNIPPTKEEIMGKVTRLQDERRDPMVMPLLSDEHLAEYLSRYQPPTIAKALEQSGHDLRAVHTDFDIIRRQPKLEPGMEIVRVLRVIEYTGPRTLVERQVQRSLHGTRGGERWQRDDKNAPTLFHEHADNARCQITAVTLGEYPEVLETARTVPDAPLHPIEEGSISHGGD